LQWIERDRERERERERERKAKVRFAHVLIIIGLLAKQRFAKKLSRHIFSKILETPLKTFPKRCRNALQSGRERERGVSVGFSCLTCSRLQVARCLLDGDGPTAEKERERKRERDSDGVLRSQIAAPISVPSMPEIFPEINESITQIVSAVAK
jgi:hypothetical protein